MEWVKRVVIDRSERGSERKGARGLSEGDRLLTSKGRTTDFTKDSGPEVPAIARSLSLP